MSTYLKEEKKELQRKERKEEIIDVTKINGVTFYLNSDRSLSVFCRSVLTGIKIKRAMLNYILTCITMTTRKIKHDSIESSTFMPAYRAYIHNGGYIYINKYMYLCIYLKNNITLLISSIHHLFVSLDHKYFKRKKL